MVTRKDSRLIELATNGDCWLQCDSPLSNPNDHIGNSCDINLDNHTMMYFYRQYSKTIDECLIINLFYGMYYCLCMIMFTNISFFIIFHLKGCLSWYFSRYFSNLFQSLALTIFTDGAPYSLLYDDVIKWKHFPRLLAICAGNSPVPGEFPTQRPVTRSFDVYFDLRPEKRLSKQSWGWWFETLSHSLWRHRNGMIVCLDFLVLFHRR